MPVHYDKDGIRIGLLAAEEPPHSGAGKTPRTRAIESVLPLLREQRGTWYRIGEFPVKSTASSVAGNLRKRHDSVYEWQARTNGEGSMLWGRYVGKTKR